MSRRARGEVQALVLDHINKNSPGQRYTPYGLAALLGLSAGSVTAAVKALINYESITVYGTSPLIVGRK